MHKVTHVAYGDLFIDVVQHMLPIERQKYKGQVKLSMKYYWHILSDFYPLTISILDCIQNKAINPLYLTGYMLRKQNTKTLIWKFVHWVKSKKMR